MSALREKTRRFWTSVLFVILGPVALCVTCGVLYWQRTPQVSALTENRFSLSLNYGVSLGRRERVRPGVQRFVDVKIQSRETNETILFCPEIYRVVLSDFNLLYSFATSFDKRGRNTDEDELNAVSYINQEEFTNQIENHEKFSEVIRDSFPQLKSFVLIVLPQVFYKSSQSTEITDALTDRLIRSIDNDSATSSRSTILCVVAEEIKFLEESDFETVCSTKDDNLPLRSNQELIGVFRTAVFQTQRGSAVCNTEVQKRNEILTFAAESPTLEKFRALCFNSQKYARIDALFELRKISAPVPYYASIFKDKINKAAILEFDTSRYPTPGVFASLFVPFFNILDTQGWLTGRVIFKSGCYSPNTRWTAVLDDFHLCCCDLENICERFYLPAFTGEISDLTVLKGQICDGVFRGEGSIRILEGSIPFKVIEKFHAKNLLNVSPQQTMKLRFINDATPFNELELLFSFDEDGVTLDSNYRNKIIAFYEKDTIKYGFFLTEEAAGKRAPYSEPLTALFDSEDERSYWNPLVRNAINHLPIPTTADNRPDERYLR